MYTREQSFNPIEFDAFRSLQAKTQSHERENS